MAGISLEASANFSGSCLSKLNVKSGANRGAVAQRERSFNCLG